MLHNNLCGSYNAAATKKQQLFFFSFYFSVLINFPLFFLIKNLTLAEQITVGSIAATAPTIIIIII